MKWVLGNGGASLATLLLAGAFVANGQVTTSSISGHVFDPSGRVVSDAEVKAVDAQRAKIRIAITDVNGSYSLIGMAPAVYSISVRAPGFSELTRPNAPLALDTALNLDFQLTVGGPKTQVEVNAPLISLQTETADLGFVIDQHFTETLPLNARDFLQLALLAPGAFPSVQGSQLSSNGANSMEVNGGREEYNNFLLDGMDNNDPYVNGYVVQPAVDSVQEFKMVTSSYGAEYGRSAAGQVNVITRQGTNDFHASAYEYVRNGALDARNYFDGAGFAKPAYVRNQFGLATGGPIRKNRTFFFANVDFFRQSQSISQQALVPTDDERAGKLGDLGVMIVDPLTGQPFPNNTIPSGSISPIATDILKLYPEPNLSGSAYNYLGQPTDPEDHQQDTFRVDHRLSQRDELTLRYTMGTVSNFQPYQEGVTGAAPGFGDYINDHTHNAMVRAQHTFGSSAFNSLWLGFNRFSRDFLPQNYQANVGQLWDVSWLNLPSRDYGYPIVNVAPFAQLGDNFAFPNLRATNTYQIGDGFTLIHGASTFKLGAEARIMQLNGHLDELVRGELSFFGGISGSPLSDLLLGYPSMGIQAQANNPIHLRSTSYAVYFQDDWKLRPNLVSNLGGRYEFNSPATDPTDGMSELDFQTGQIVQVGHDGVTASGIHPDYKNFAPRVGIEWHAAPALVLRAGYGVFYDSGMFIVGSAAYFNPPQFTMNVFFPSDAGLLTLQDPFPTSAAYAPPATLSVLSPATITPYLQQWNLTAESSLGHRGTLTLNYAGSAGTHLIRERDLNQPSPGSADLQSRRQFSQFANIFYIETEGSSNFNALEMRFTGHVTPGLSLWGAYTYSHSIDGSSAFLGDTADPNFPQNSNNLPAERGPSSFDMRQRLVAAGVLTLPHGNRWTRDTEFQGIATVQSGQPFTPIISFDNSNTGNTGQQSGSDRPNRIGNPHLSHPSASQWFNPAAFAVAPPFTFGNAGRNSLLGPGFASMDISLMRTFRLRERGTLTLEAQSFNLLNRPNFNLPAVTADLPTFGAISSANDPRQLQMAARLTF
jgi:hypothetical protein